MDTKQEQTPQLSKAIADKYELKKIQPGTYAVAGYGTVDLTNISLAAAEQLVKSGKFPLLVEKAKKKADESAEVKPV